MLMLFQSLFMHIPSSPKKRNHLCIIPQDGQHPQRQHEAAQAGPAAPAHRGEAEAEEV